MENYERLQGLLLKIKDHYCGGKGAELARRIKRSDSYVNRLFYPPGKNGAKGIGPEIMEACREAFNLPRGFWELQPDQAFAEGDDDAMDLDAHPDLVPIRKVQLRLRAGVQGYQIESEETNGIPIFFRATWLQERGYKPYKLIAIKVQGQSMEPNLYQEDMVVINTADTEPKDGKVFAVNYEGEAVIKRLVRDGGTWWIASDNPDQRRFPRKECTEGACIIVGMVVHKQSEQI